MKKDIKFNSHGQQLSGDLYKAIGKEKAGLLILSGGGNLPHKQSHYPLWQKELAKNGITSFSFDYRGVEVGGIGLGETNINTRIEDSVLAFDILSSNMESKNIYVYGKSMGGPVAIEIANQMHTAGLILVVPAAYSQEAREKNFGPDFSAVIRKPESWKDSIDFENLKKYTGNILLVYAKKDEVIPTDVCNSYVNIVHNKKGKILAFENAKHRFMDEVNEQGVKLGDILKSELLEFIISIR